MRWSTAPFNHKAERVRKTGWIFESVGVWMHFVKVSGVPIRLYARIPCGAVLVPPVNIVEVPATRPCAIFPLPREPQKLPRRLSPAPVLPKRLKPTQPYTPAARVGLPDRCPQMIHAQI